MNDTCAERLLALAAKPEHATIRGELLLAAAELKAYRELLGAMQTPDGWCKAMGYVSRGPCHTCGQDIYEPPLPPLNDPRWQKVQGSEKLYETVVQRSGDKTLPDI